MHWTLDHLALNVRDVEESLHFYSEILGLTPLRAEEFRSGKVPFPSVQVNPETIIDLFPRPKPNLEDFDPGMGSLNHFCLAVTQPEWQRLRERLRVHDITPKAGPMQRFGARGEGISIYFQDPDGNQIEARYYDVQPQQNYQVGKGGYLTWAGSGSMGKGQR